MILGELLLVPIPAEDVFSGDPLAPRCGPRLGPYSVLEPQGQPAARAVG